MSTTHYEKPRIAVILSVCCSEDNEFCEHKAVHRTYIEEQSEMVDGWRTHGRKAERILG